MKKVVESVLQSDPGSFPASPHLETTFKLVLTGRNCFTCFKLAPPK
jgi:hypothetical protein